MKKVIKGIILIIVIAFILCGCSTKSKFIKEISYDEFEKKLNNKESFALYIGNDNCTHCNSYKPTLKKVLKDYNITIFQIDNSKLSENEYNKLNDKLGVNGTPTILFIANGEEETTLNRIVGETTYEDTVEIFKTNDYIK